MEKWARECGLEVPLDVAEVGCGGGQFSIELARRPFARSLVLVEPDPEMLNEARAVIDLQPSKLERLEFVCAGGENTGLEGQSADVVCSASAFHWMPRERTVREFLRLVRRPGLLYFVEYAFPTSAARPQLDSWVGTKLKTEWQIPQLRDRESFSEMVSVFSRERGVKSLGTQRLAMTGKMDAASFWGFLQTQSRYVIAREKRGSIEERERFDRENEAVIRRLMGNGDDTFDFHLQAAGFALEP